MNKVRLWIVSDLNPVFLSEVSDEEAARILHERLKEKIAAAVGKVLLDVGDDVVWDQEEIQIAVTIHKPLISPVILSIDTEEDIHERDKTPK